MSETPDRMRERPASDDAIEDATAHYAAPRDSEGVRHGSVLVFRLGAEWLAFRTGALDRVAEPRPVHSLPQRRGGATAGLVNVGGDLVVHTSLAGLLGVEPLGAPPRNSARKILARLLVLADPRGRIAMTVDEVWGVHHYALSSERPVPPTLARAPSSFTTAMLEVDGRAVGCLDSGRVMDALSLAIS